MTPLVQSPTMSWSPTIVEQAFLFERLLSHRPYLANRGDISICNDLQESFRGEFSFVPPMEVCPSCSHDELTETRIG